MNYFEKRERIERLLGSSLPSEFPQLYRFIFDQARRNLAYWSSGRPLELRNPFRSDYDGTRTYREPKYLAKTAMFLALPKQKMPRDATVLIGVNLYQRFPHLVKRIAKDHNVSMIATRANAVRARNALKGGGVQDFIKIDSVIYRNDLGRELAVISEKVRYAVDHDQPIDTAALRGSFQRAEKAIGEVVERLAHLYSEYKVTQFISAFASRFDEILSCLACRQIGAPSKEILHGTNSLTLEASDNIIPTNTDYLYVWSPYYVKNVGAFPEIERVKLGGFPKFSESELKALQDRYPMQKMITWFSQATYDMGDIVGKTITPEFQVEERKYRDQVLRELKRIKDELGYKVRIRYHPGERVPTAICDRTEEFIRVKEMGFETSDLSFDQDLFESHLCLGVNTSVLWEAMVSGKNVVQIICKLSGDVNFYPEVDRIELADLVQYTKNLRPDQPPIRRDLLLDIDKMLADGIKR
jgi:hypothetical protein